MQFTDLNVKAALAETLRKKGYVQPTPIQQQAIPAALQGRDIFGCAQTGTGKTAAFALPIIQKLSDSTPDTNGQQARRKKPIQALILAPTRELANQISDNIAAYSVGLRLAHAVVYGGASMRPQIEKLQRGVDIVIATPGRLLDLMNQGYVHLDNVKFFVLDEADRMLDMGFITDIKHIISLLPKQKQTLFFSATTPSAIKKLAASLLHDPLHITIETPKEKPSHIEQSVFFVEKDSKQQLLTHILKEHGIEHALVFTRTKRSADRLVRDLKNSGYRSDCIHGNKSQSAREKALFQFKNRKLNVLVATDVAARGIDVDKLTHVINYELPDQSETYIHRIGRTGRGGESGTAISFCSNDEKRYLRDINKMLKKNISVVATHPFHGRRG